MDSQMSFMDLDPRTGRAFEPIDPKTLELIFGSDKGYWLGTFFGFLYWCHAELRLGARDHHPSQIPRSVKSSWTLDCPRRYRLYVYKHAYARWAATSAEAQSTLAVLCTMKDDGPALRTQVGMAVCRGRVMYQEGHSLPSIKLAMLTILRSEVPPVTLPQGIKLQMDCLDSFDQLDQLWATSFDLPRYAEKNRVTALPNPPSDRWPIPHRPGTYLHLLRPVIAKAHKQQFTTAILVNYGQFNNFLTCLDEKRKALRQEDVEMPLLKLATCAYPMREIRIEDEYAALDATDDDDEQALAGGGEGTR